MRDGAEVDHRFEVDQRSSDRWPIDDTEPDVTEKITLIEFTWMGPRGAQPVILVAREWLQ